MPVYVFTLSYCSVAAVAVCTVSALVSSQYMHIPCQLSCIHMHTIKQVDQVDELIEGYSAFTALAAEASHGSVDMEQLAYGAAGT
jgi:hypothetical protein